MGQASTKLAAQSLLLTSVDRLQASNAGAGMSAAASHVVLLGENAGAGLGALSYVFIVGSSSMSAGVTSLAQNGSTAFGGLILPLWRNTVAPPTVNGPVAAQGYNIFPLMVNRLGNDIFVGANIGALMPANANEVSSTIIIGNDALGRQRILNANGGLGIVSSVIIGDKAARGGPFTQDGAGANMSNSVIIGGEAMGNSGFDLNIPGVQANFNVVIGYQSALNAASLQNSTFQNVTAVGPSCFVNVRNATNGIAIGGGITGATGVGGQTSFTLVGHGIVGAAVDGSTGNTVLGSFANVSGLGSQNIIIGNAANSSAQIPGGASNRFLVENSTGTLLYGIVTNTGPGPGGLVVGHSTEAASRDIPGFNLLKIVNGSWNTTAPIGGGVFYSAAGELHWVSTAGVDYSLTPSNNRGTFTVATLPATGLLAGQRAFVSDATAPTWNAAPAGGGAVFAPVFYTGAAWRMG